MKLVPQESETDCGPAAVATLCRVELSDAHDFIYGRRGRKGVTSSGCLIEAIREFGREPLGTQCRGIGERKLYDLTNDALLGCFALEHLAEEVSRRTAHKWKNHSHWAVWDARRKLVLDPYIKRGQLPLHIVKYLEVK